MSESDNSIMYAHTDAYFAGLSLMTQSVSIVIFFVCSYLSVTLFLKTGLRVGYGLLGLLGAIAVILTSQFYLNKLDGVVVPELYLVSWILLDMFNLGLLHLKLQRLRIIRIGHNRTATILFYANCASAFATFLAFTWNAMVTVGYLSSDANNPQKDNIQVALVILSRIMALVIDTPTAIFFRSRIMNDKKFSFRNIQHLEIILCLVALYTVGILGIRTVQVHQGTKTDRLLAFATTQWPGTLSLFLAIQYSSLLRSIDHAKQTVQQRSKDISALASSTRQLPSTHRMSRMI